MLRRKGYLLVDTSLALFLVSIMTLTMFSSYKIYKKMSRSNNAQLEYMDKFRAITMEIQYNISFIELQEKEKEKEYYINVKDINTIIDTPIIELIEEVNKGFNEYGILRILETTSENFMDIELKWIKDSGNIEFNNEEIIRRYSFLK